MSFGNNLKSSAESTNKLQEVETNYLVREIMYEMKLDLIKKSRHQQLIAEIM